MSDVNSAKIVKGTFMTMITLLLQKTLTILLSSDCPGSYLGANRSGIGSLSGKGDPAEEAVATSVFLLHVVLESQFL